MQSLFNFLPATKLVAYNRDLDQLLYVTKYESRFTSRRPQCAMPCICHDVLPKCSSGRLCANRQLKIRMGFSMHFAWIRVGAHRRTLSLAAPRHRGADLFDPVRLSSLGNTHERVHQQHLHQVNSQRHLTSSSIFPRAGRIRWPATFYQDD
jgi:hypothetical protein